MKERLLGAAVLIVAAVIIIPALLDGPRQPETVSSDLALPAPESGNSSSQPGSENRVHTVEIETGKSRSGQEPMAQPEEPVPPPAIPPKRSEPTPPPAAGPATAAPAEADQNRREAAPTPVPVTKPVPPIDGWAVQVGSFTSESNARRLMEYLKGDGYPAFVVRNVVNGRVMFRVRVGPESDRLRAEALVDRLKSDRQQTQLVRHP